MKTMDNKTNWPQACPDAAVMVAYCEGKLSPSEQHALEMHVLDCPLCEDALEGIQQMQQPDHLHRIKTELDQSVNEKTQKGRVIPLFKSAGFRIAAMVSIIIISAGILIYFLPDSQDNNIALESLEKASAPVEQTEKENTSIATDIQQVPKVNPDRSVPAEKAPASTEERNIPISAANEPSERGDETIREEDTDSEMARDLGKAATDETVSSSELSALESDSKYLKKEVAQTESTREPQVLSSVKPATEEITTKTTAATKSKGAATTSERSGELFTQGLRFFGDKKYAEALSCFKRVTEIPNARYYEGRCYFELNRHKEAVKALTEFTSGKSTIEHEAAWWYKALSQKQLNDISGAKKSLEKVVEFNGQYEQQARSMLRTLQ
jgi:tetratricopeptide (TPR) repeat protein